MINDKEKEKLDRKAAKTFKSATKDYLKKVKQGLTTDYIEVGVRYYEETNTTAKIVKIRVVEEYEEGVYKVIEETYELPGMNIEVEEFDVETFRKKFNICLVEQEIYYKDKKGKTLNLENIKKR